MAEPTIVPPIPTITQPGGSDNSPGMEQVQKAFDQVLPAIKTQPTQKEPAKPAQEPTEPVKPPEEQVKPPVQEPAKESQPSDVPSFLEEALRGTPSQEIKPPGAPAEEEWPEELPQFKTPEESKERYKKWRQAYGELKTELKNLREKPTLDSSQLQRMETLEKQNQQMQALLSRVGVEQSEEFNRSIMQPLYASWGEAVKIVRDAGGDPQRLASAMSLSGKAQFEALDELFSDLPESAKAEAHDALRQFRRYEDMRQRTIANAPAAMEGIRKREMERQNQELTRQREDMKGMFDQVVSTMRDKARLELLIKTDKPDGKWWNDQGDNIIEQARALFLENTDMSKVAMACLLAPAADAYRKLWLRSQQKIGQLQKIIEDKIGSEPNLSESGGSQVVRNPDQQLQADLSRPFTEVFLREFHKSRARSR